MYNTRNDIKVARMDIVTLS